MLSNLGKLIMDTDAGGAEVTGLDLDAMIRPTVRGAVYADAE